jgi:ribosome-associated protein
MTLDEIKKIAVAALEDIKGKDIIVLDTHELSDLFDCMIVASGDSNRQVRAMANNVREELKSQGIEIISMEGEESGEWVLVDTGDLIVHIMQPAVRDYYNLEELWGGQRPSFNLGHKKPWSALDGAEK